MKNEESMKVVEATINKIVEESTQRVEEYKEQIAKLEKERKKALTDDEEEEIIRKEDKEYTEVVQDLTELILNLLNIDMENIVCEEADDGNELTTYIHNHRIYILNVNLSMNYIRLVEITDDEKEEELFIIHY